MPGIIIEKELCTRCNTCGSVCLMGIIVKATESTFPSVPEKNFGNCLRCGHCESFCTQKALTLDFLTEEKGGESVPDESVDPHELASYMKMRRSVRHFNSKPVSKDLISQVLDVARYAPSGGNGQPVKWHVVYDSSDVSKIASLTIEWMRTLINTSHPLSGYVRGIVLIWDRGVDYICHNAPHLLFAHLPNADPSNDNTDAIIAMTHFDIAAPLYGFSTCWAGFVSMAAVEYKPLKDFIALPDDRRIAYAMMLGYSTYKVTSIPRRNHVDVSWQ